MTDTLNCKVQINIVLPTADDTKWPEKKLAEAELEFVGGFAKGATFVGFTIWRNKKGGRTVSFPSRPYEKNGGKEYFDYVQGRGGRDDIERFILAAFDRKVAAEAEADTD